MHTLVPLLVLIGALVQGARAARRVAPPGQALVGEWHLDRARTHYGASAAPRRSERFTCTAREAALACEISGEREDGRSVAARFRAPAEGAPGPVSGLPEIDSVRVRTVSASIADATFSRRGVPAFGYRAYRTPDGRTLTIVAVDPVTRAALTSVVVYRRR